MISSSMGVKGYVLPSLSYLVAVRIFQGFIWYAVSLRNSFFMCTQTSCNGSSKGTEFFWSVTNSEPSF